MARRVADIYLKERFTEDPDRQEAPAAEPVAVARAEVNPAVFDDYEGSYSFPSGVLVEVERDGDRLMAQATGQPRVELIPRSDSEFFVAEASVTIKFRREQEKVMELLLVQGDVAQTARRVPPFDPAEVVLEDYVGRYYSPELETSYSLVVEEGELTAVHVRHDPITIEPVGPDRFGGNFGQIQFERDDEGAVTRMLISSGRVRNLRFERVSW
jgi:hypothetical protein